MGTVLFRMSDYNRTEFGWTCGGTFIPDRAKCWTDPKTGKRLKTPINHQVYQRIVGSKGKAAQTLYRDREQAIRDRRRAAVPGWKNKPPQVDIQKQRSQWASKLKELDDPKELTVNQYEDRLKDYLPPDVYREYEQVSTERDRLSRAASSATRKKDKETTGKAFDDFNKGKYAEIWSKVNHNAAKQGYPDLQQGYPELAQRFGKKDKPALNLDGNYKDTPQPPKESNKKLIKAEDLRSAADREAYATQELAEAKKSGDQSRIKSWEEQAKKARMAKLKADQQSQKTTQTSLFNPLAYDKDLQDAPLLKGLLFKKRIKHRADFTVSGTAGVVLFRMASNAEFGWKCGDTFIPNNRKCYTDPKTGIKLKTPLTFKEYTKQRAQVYRDAQRGQLPQDDYDRSLLQSVSDRQVKLKTQKEKLQLTQAAASVGARQVLPSGIAEVEVSKLKVDPKRFQYKILGAQTQSGSVGSLSGVRTWDANLAGIIQVWQDPKDKQVYVVNGHNRTERAKALGVQKMTAKFIKAKTPEEARSIGALTNVAEGRGTSLDAAKFFRDSGVSREDLERKGIPMREKIATDGLALSRLNEPLFNRVVQGTLPEQRAVTIGNALKDHKQQQELVDLIEKEEKRGKKINNDAIQELTDMVVGAPKIQESQGGLFDLLGFTPETRSLAVEKAQLQAGIKRQLSREKKLFGTVGKSRAAEDLAKAGNQINVEQSAEISETASKSLDAFDKEKNLSGATSTAINRAAERIANGENPKKVEKETYDEVLADLQKTYKFGEGSGSRVAKRRIGDNRLAASRHQGQTAEFGTGLKRRLKRRKPPSVAHGGNPQDRADSQYCCSHAKFNSTYTRRTKKGKTVIVRKGKRKKDGAESRKRLIGGAGLALSAVTGSFSPIDYYRWKAVTGKN